MSSVAEVPVSMPLVLMAWAVTRLPPSSDSVPETLAALNTLLPREINVNPGALVIPNDRDDTLLFSTLVNVSPVATSVRFTMVPSGPSDCIATGIVAFTVTVLDVVTNALAGNAPSSASEPVPENVNVCPPR